MSLSLRLRLRLSQQQVKKSRAALTVAYKMLSLTVLLLEREWLDWLVHKHVFETGGRLACADVARCAPASAGAGARGGQAFRLLAQVSTCARQRQLWGVVLQL